MVHGKMDLIEIGCERIGWNKLAHERVNSGTCEYVNEVWIA
jgi:hypothetical protein